MHEFKPCSTPFATDSKLFPEDSDKFDQPLLFRSLKGALQYLILTGPDISYFVNKLSQFLQNPTQLQWKAYQHVLRYIRGTLNHGLSFHKNSNLQLECFSDFDWASILQDRRSPIGYSLFLGTSLIHGVPRSRRLLLCHPLKLNTIH